MKNAIKKLSALTLAFTLLGTGTAAAKIIAPKSDNSITAYADDGTGSYDVFYNIKKIQVTATSGLNIRSGPSTDYSKIGALNYGDTAYIYGTKNGWGKLNPKGTKWICLGWVKYI